jgi:hypothetical protein
LLLVCSSEKWDIQGELKWVFGRRKEFWIESIKYGLWVI